MGNKYHSTVTDLCHICKPLEYWANSVDTVYVHACAQKSVPGVNDYKPGIIPFYGLYKVLITVREVHSLAVHAVQNIHILEVCAGGGKPDGKPGVS